jgi:transcription elongation factor Elf1
VSENAEAENEAEKPDEADLDDAPADSLSAASSAFEVLGNETRMAILEGLIADDGPGVVPVERSFTELFERTDEETTAGFAYHLRQLVGQYVAKDEESERYRLTYAGGRVARELVAGTYVESVDRSPVELADPCPFCDGTTLQAETADNVVSVRCRECSVELLSLPFPPGGHRTQGEAFVEAFNRHHRRRVATMSAGSCPECGGAVSSAVRPVSPPGVAKDDDEGVLVHLDCDGCGYRVRVPVTMTVLDHPAVVSLYNDHGVDVRERPVWNVGDEWRETLLSTDPLAVRVSTALGDDELSLYVDGTASVVHTERGSFEDSSAGEGDASGAEGEASEEYGEVSTAQER